MAGPFSTSTLEQIRAANDIVEVIGAVLPLKRAGGSWVALCPFHKEKTPSFHVNPQRQIFHCFGCHHGGDVFKFIQDYERLNFPEAVRRLAERAGIPLAVTREPGDSQLPSVREALLQIHEQITQHWQQVLARDAAGQKARDYLGRRGVSPEAVSLFRLGCAADAWDDTVNWARAKGIDLALALQAGLILRQEETGRYYDRFRGRLIFPIADEQGRIIGFSGRVLDEQEKTGKYVNSPETPIFTKGKVIYGLDKSKRALLDAQRAIICEGQLDLIACYQAGIHNVVAPQGTALTADHTRILKRYVPEVVLCFDADAAGQKAMVRSLDDLLASGLAIRVATIPAPHDPDSFIKTAGGAAFQQRIEQAAGFFDFLLHTLCAANDVTTDKGRRTVVQEMAWGVQKTGDPVLVDAHAQKTALRIGVSPDAVRAEFRKLGHPKTSLATSPAPDQTVLPPADRPGEKEYWLLKLLFHEDSDIAWVTDHLDPDWVRHSVVRQIVSARLAAHLNQTWHGVAAFLNELALPAAQDLLSEALSDPRPIPQPGQQLADVLLRLRNQKLDRDLAALTLRASQPGLAAELQLDLNRQMMELRQQKRQPLSPLTHP